MSLSNRWLPRGAAATLAVTLALTLMAGSSVAGASPAPKPTVSAAAEGGAFPTPDTFVVQSRKKQDPPALVPQCEFFPPSAGPPIILRCTGPNGHGFLIVPFPPFFLVF